MTLNEARFNLIGFAVKMRLVSRNRERRDALEGSRGAEGEVPLDQNGAAPDECRWKSVHGENKKQAQFVALLGDTVAARRG